jgi:uncharacterized protein YebE (UPF0316 family)
LIGLVVFIVNVVYVVCLQGFVDLCVDVYNILRANATLLVSLVSLAIPCNLPELREVLAVCGVAIHGFGECRE